MGKLIPVEFRKRKPKPRGRKRGLALAHGATPGGRVFVAASGRRYFTTEEFTALLAELRETRDDAIAKRKAPKRG